MRFRTEWGSSDFGAFQTNGYDGVRIYLREIGRIRRPTREEERLLVRGVRRGDSEARGQLIQTHLWLVVTIARAYLNFGLPLLDLVSEGNVGLVKAVDRFDSRGGYRFSTYARWWVRDAIIGCLANQSRLIRIPRRQIDRARRVLRMSIQLEQTLGREATLDEVAGAMGVSADRLRIVCRVLPLPVSLDEPVAEGQELILAETIEDVSGAIPGQQERFDLSQETLDRLLGVLSPRERHVVEQRYGLNSVLPQTLEAIGRELGVTHEAVRQIEAKALRRIRHPGRLRWLREHLEGDFPG
jgi:RNA polymerase primary sigma factor